MVAYLAELSIAQSAFAHQRAPKLYAVNIDASAIERVSIASPRTRKTRHRSSEPGCASTGLHFPEYQPLSSSRLFCPLDRTNGSQHFRHCSCLDKASAL